MPVYAKGSCGATMSSPCRGTDNMRRRDVIGVVATAAGWPLATRAQQQVQTIGVLAAPAPPYIANVAAVRLGLEETGYVEGRNLALEYRWAEGHYDRLPALALELV